MLLGEQIQKIRKRAGLTQAELGRRLGVSGSMVGQWEGNHRAPKYETIARIAKALDVTVEYLFGLCDSPPLDETDDPIKAATEYVEATREARYVRAIEFANIPYGHNIITYFRLLNEAGQQEAANRVWELASLAKYQRTNEDEPWETVSNASPVPPPTDTEPPSEGQ